MQQLRHLLVPFAIVASATAQTESADSLNTKAVAAAEAGRWEEALALYDRCIEVHGENALAKFGPSFGVTWYRKGMCEMRLQRWEAAARSFEICYRDFPNKAKTKGNRFNKTALVRWGEATRAAGRPQDALPLFKKFLSERDRQTDEFDPANYYIQVALCHLQLGELVLGTENLETAVRNKGGFATPDTGIVAALQSLVATAIAKNDGATLRGFFERNREALAIPPAEMAAYTDVFVKLATDALGAGMEGAAVAIFHLIPTSEAMAKDLRTKLETASDKTALQARLDAVEQARRDGVSHDVLLLETNATYQEKQGNLAASKAAFSELVERYPKAPRRTDHLFHLVRVSAALGDTQEVEKQAGKFLLGHPDSPQAPAVKRMLLVTLFEQKQFEPCIKIAAEMLPALAEGSAEHDLCLRVLAGSYEQTGRFEEARPLLERHVTLYPASPYAQTTQYLRASNLVELKRWEEAAKQLDEFIAKHPDAAANPYLAVALLDRAECHASLEQDGAALEKLARLEKEFPGSEALANAQSLKSELLLRQGKEEEAEKSLAEALQQAEKQEQKETAANLLLHLVTLIGSKDSSRWKDALPYCERFWKSYSDLPKMKARMAVAQAEIYLQAGRGKEALERLKECFGDEAPSEALIRLYARLCAKEHGTEKLKQDFAALPGIKPEDKATRAVLKIALIGELEAKLPDPGARQDAEAQLKSLYQELKSEFEAKDLPASVLLRTGDFLRLQTSAPRQALPYYAEALARNEQALRFPALLGRATILAEGSKEERAGAIKDLQEVVAGSKEVSEREDALYWLIMSRMKDSDFAAAAESAQAYLAPDSGFQRLTPEVRLALARSLQERGMIDEALASYAQVWSDSLEATRVSVSAMRFWMQISWTRNSPANGSERPRSDRQAAYDEAVAFLERTKPLYDKMASIDQEAWLEIEKLVAEFAATTDVKPVPKQAEAGKPK
jgi:tetratricopeptide (TPR) repeat protein